MSELESFGDACYKLGSLLKRKHECKMEFTEGQKTEIEKMLNLVEEALTQMNEVVSGRREDQDINESFRLEHEINDLRTKIKADNIHAVNDHQYDYSLGTLYTDLISECEKLGDYIINVVEARLK